LIIRDKANTGTKFHDSWPRIFDNAPGSPAFEVGVVDALMASSAAPTYWPIFNGCIDGGIKYNNPSLLALTEAIKRGNKLEDLSLLSVGTGLNPEFQTEQNSNWGLSQWAPVLLKILLSNDSAVDIQAANLLGSRFLRIQPELTTNIDLDDYTKLNQLIDVANKFDLKTASSWLGQYYQVEMKSVA